MEMFWHAMKQAAIMRHMALVAMTHGHNVLAYKQELAKHLRFVDRVYAPMGV